MALGLTFEQSNNGKTLTISEASDAGTNLTGAVITITFNGETATPILTGWTTAGNESVEVTADEIGQTANTAFSDGVYSITYTTTADPTGVSYNVLLDYNVKYCVYNMYRQLPDIHACNTLCTNKQVERVQFMGTMLKSLEYSAACGQVNEINTILSTLQNLCLNSGVNECYCS